MSEIKVENIENLTPKHINRHENYEYIKRDFVKKWTGDCEGCVVIIYEIPPKKSNYPYHYHNSKEEVFYIISGEGLLRTPEGERKVKAGDIMFFPAGEKGAHKLTNTSDNENLKYIDFDTAHKIDVCTYPDSKKVAIWGEGYNKVYNEKGETDYYDGE